MSRSVVRALELVRDRCVASADAAPAPQACDAVGKWPLAARRRWAERTLELYHLGEDLDRAEDIAAEEMIREDRT